MSDTGQHFNVEFTNVQRGQPAPYDFDRAAPDPLEPLREAVRNHMHACVDAVGCPDCGMGLPCDHWSATREAIEREVARYAGRLLHHAVWVHDVTVTNPPIQHCRDCAYIRELMDDRDD